MEVGFSSSSMTDLIFLLLLFMMLSTTLINPNAVKLTLPKATNQLKDKPVATVSITADLNYYVGTESVPFDRLEEALVAAVKDAEIPSASLHCDKSVPIEEVVKVMKIAIKNKIKLTLATAPE